MRPYVICHMLTSMDQKVTGDFLNTPTAMDAAEIYYRIHRQSKAQGFACGRATMESSFTQGWYPEFEKKGKPASCKDYIGEKGDFYAVSFDRQGRLGWKDNRLHDEDPGYDGALVIEVLTQQVDESYLSYLRSKNISYLFAGQNEMDIALALEKLHDLFGIEMLLLEGGSILNGAFEKAGCIDALSLVVAPITADENAKSLFDQGSVEAYALKQLEWQDHNCIWMRYTKKQGK